MARTATVTSLRVINHAADNSELAGRLRERDRSAQAILYERFAPQLAKTLFAIMGPDEEVEDLLQETFLSAFDSVGRLSDPDNLLAWLRSIAVFRARNCIRRRRRWRWVQVLGSADSSEANVLLPNLDAAEALASTYSVLQDMAPDERIVFALRYIEQEQLAVVASMCGVSLATVKRRLAAAEKHFAQRAKRHSALADWISGGRRWPEP